jgi:hypothetical protein
MAASTKVRIGKITWLLGIITSIALISLAAGLHKDQQNQSAVLSPKVISIVQATHDKVSKTNLLSDDSHLYVTEFSAGRHVIAKLSLQGSNRSIVHTPFSNVQAVDLSRNRPRLLISAIQGGSSNNEFWTLPSKSGSPKRVGDVTGRDASWSTNGQDLVFAKGSGLSIASSTGIRAHELFSADGSIFAPRFSPDGQRIRFTVGNAELNTTTLWEIRRNGSNPHALARLAKCRNRMLR